MVPCLPCTHNPPCGAIQVTYAEKKLAKIVRQRNVCTAQMLCCSPLAIQCGKLEDLTEKCRRLNGLIAALNRDVTTERRAAGVAFLTTKGAL